MLSDKRPVYPGGSDFLKGLLGFILEFLILQILLVCAGIMTALLWPINLEQTPKRDRGR
jgi:hypothetical protein